MCFVFIVLVWGGLCLFVVVGGDNFYFCFFGQVVNFVGDYVIFGGKFGVDDYFLVVLDVGCYVVFVDFIFIVQYLYEMFFVVYLQCGGRDYYCVLLGVYQQVGVNELIGEQCVVQIVKVCFQFDGFGGCIDLVIEVQQFVDVDFLFIGVISGFDVECFVCFLCLYYCGDVVFWKGKDYVDWVCLGKDYDFGGIFVGDLVVDIDLF